MTPVTAEHRRRRGELGRWRPKEDRPDPVDLVEMAHSGRLERLVPVRVGRMVASPYAFLRGSASLMAENFASMPRTGIEPVICGDAHLGNFGFYASPERDLVFDLNDFDEAHPGPWEWDLWRLATSIWVAGRQNGLAEGTCEDAALWCAAAPGSIGSRSDPDKTVRLDQRRAWKERSEPRAFGLVAKAVGPVAFYPG